MENLNLKYSIIITILLLLLCMMVLLYGYIVIISRSLATQFTTSAPVIDN